MRGCYIYVPHNNSLDEYKMRLSYIVSIMVADDLATQKAGSPTTMILTIYSSHRYVELEIIPSAPDSTRPTTRQLIAHSTTTIRQRMSYVSKYQNVRRALGCVLRVKSRKKVYYLALWYHFTFLFFQNNINAWWRYQMEKFSASLALCAGNSPVTGEFPSQMPVTRNFDIFFDLRLE